MRRYFIAVLCLLFLSLSGSFAAEEKSSADGLAAGIILGEPTGLSLRYKSFPVIGVAWSIDNYFHLHCDYWFVNKEIQNGIRGYIGGGVKVMFFSEDDSKHDDNEDHSFGLGLRVPFGLQYILEKKVEFFAEIVPGMKLYSETKADLDLGIGVRYLF